MLARFSRRLRPAVGNDLRQPLRTYITASRRDVGRFAHLQSGLIFARSYGPIPFRRSVRTALFRLLSAKTGAFIVTAYCECVLTRINYSRGGITLVYIRDSTILRRITRISGAGGTLCQHTKRYSALCEALFGLVRVPAQPSVLFVFVVRRSLKGCDIFCDT